MRTRRGLALLASSTALLAIASPMLSAADDCPCGYYDETSRALFTETLIVYFNESSTLPLDVFEAESYTHRYERGWNRIFRQGASPDNVHLANVSTDGQTAELVVSPSTPDHLVVGGGLRSLRQDMQYGIFMAAMKSPGPWAGGSSLTMELQYNYSQSISANLQNADTPQDAWLSTLLNDEFPDRSLGVNYTQFSNLALDPWGLNQLRIEWLPKSIAFLMDGIVLRNTTGDCADGSSRPSTPSPFTLKHWSTGDPYAMQGPPLRHPSSANVAWVRLFFNSSTMSNDDHAQYDFRCEQTPACLTSDTSLRQSSPFDVAAEQAYQPPDSSYNMRWWAVGLGSFGLCITVVVLLNAIGRRLILHPSRRRTTAAEPNRSPPTVQTDMSRFDLVLPDFSCDSPISGVTTPWAEGSVVEFASGEPSAAAWGLRTPTSGDHSPILGPSDRAIMQEKERAERLRALVSELGLPRGPHHPGLSRTPSEAATPITPARSPSTSIAGAWSSRETSFLGRAAEGMSFGPAMLSRDDVSRYSFTSTRLQSMTRSTTDVPPMPALPPGLASSGNAARPTRPLSQRVPASRQRIDYLAGMVAACSILVSVTHFVLTFLPGVIEPDAPSHYDSEYWARMSVGPFFFNEVWVVIFFTTSTRFLATKYLRTGDLSSIAEKAVGRVFRLMIPIVAVILLEYFFMDVGAIGWLQYVPSVSWSTWVFTQVFPNFGSFLNEMLQLIYIIPSAMPPITFNYCTGVLWTIPVQIQGSWQALLAVVVIYEIKTPWKRFSYYATCILLHWYARSWGSFFWAGLLVADLDITYKYRKWLYARPIVYYLLLNLFIFIVIASLGNTLSAHWTGFDFSTFEHGWHPYTDTGDAIMYTADAGFPVYYTPTLNGLFFAVFLQIVVEWSVWLQRALSTKIFLWLFPHIFTIYLFHGFIFWSAGSWVCVGLAGWGVPYWANVLVTFIVCYLLLFLSLPIITPIVEALGKSCTASIWLSASETPPPKRPTLFPFPKDHFLRRTATPEAAPPQSKSSWSWSSDSQASNVSTKAVTHELDARTTSAELNEKTSGLPTGSKGKQPQVRIQALERRSR